VLSLENTLQVQIQGFSYVLRGDGEQAHLQSVGDLVGRKIEAITTACPNYSNSKSAILAALQLADELLVLEKEHMQLLGEMEKILAG
jgi:cell division protein ZapA